MVNGAYYTQTYAGIDGIRTETRSDSAIEKAQAYSITKSADNESIFMDRYLDLLEDQQDTNETMGYIGLGLSALNMFSPTGILGAIFGGGTSQNSGQQGTQQNAAGGLLGGLLGGSGGGGLLGNLLGML